MVDETKEALGAEIDAEIGALSLLTPGSDEHSAAVESLVKLCKINSEDDHLSMEKDEAVKNRIVNVGLGIIKVVVPTIFYGIWMKKGFEFEKTGAITSHTFKGLISRFKPTE